jgi:leukotriene-A4 hydrolase
MVVRNRYDAGIPALEHFLTSQGRRKFVRPLYAALMQQGDWGQPLARRIYAVARPGYHAVTTGSVDAIVK